MDKHIVHDTLDPFQTRVEVAGTCRKSAQSSTLQPRAAFLSNFTVYSASIWPVDDGALMIERASASPAAIVIHIAGTVAGYKYTKSL